MSSRHSALSGSSMIGWNVRSVKSDERRHRLLEPQQALGRHDDERPARTARGLAAQQVVELRRRRDVGDAEVVVGRELQEALEPRRGVLRPVALVAVRQEQREPRGHAPLGAARRDELVDQHLRAVGEVAELGLPDHERVAPRDRVAVLEAEAGRLGERRVVHLEARLGVGEVLHRRVALARVHVVQHEVAVRERAALGVLARQADRDAVGQQRGERERLGVAPVDAAVADRRPAPLELRPQLGMHREALGQFEQRVGERDQLVARRARARRPDRGRAPCGRRARARCGRRAAEGWCAAASCSVICARRASTAASSVRPSSTRRRA